MLRLLVAALFFAAAQSAAQSSLPPGTVFFSAEPDAYSSWKQLTHGEATEIYIVATVPEDGIRAWELSFEVPAWLWVLQVEPHPDGSVNVGPGENNLIVGMSTNCYYGEGYVTLATVTVMQIQDVGFGTEGYVTIGASSPRSLAEEVPAYANCYDETLPLATGSYLTLWPTPNCHGEPPIALIGFPGGRGGPGERIERPFEVTFTYGRFGGCDPIELSRVTFDAIWDESVVVLEDITMNPEWAAGWTATFAPLPGGGTRIELSGPPLYYDPEETLLPWAAATLGFRFGTHESDTDVTSLGIEIEDSSGGTDYWAWHRYSPDIFGPATFGPKPVSSAARSFGSLKARY